MTYTTINRKGRENLEKWLGEILRDGDLFADKWAAAIVNDFDGSFCRDRIEVGGFHTASGNPAAYTFAADELDEHEEED